MAAAAAGLITFETRVDEHGAAVLVRARRDGALYLIRPVAGEAKVAPYAPGVLDALRECRTAGRRLRFHVPGTTNA